MTIAEGRYADEQGVQLALEDSWRNKMYTDGLLR